MYQDYMQTILDGKTINSAIPSFYKELDDFIGGFRPGQLSVISASCGMGKTSFCLSILYRILRNTEKKVAYFTLGETQEKTVERMMQIDMGKSVKDIILYKETPKFLGKNLSIDTCIECFGDLKWKALVLAREGYELLCIDCIQDIELNKGCIPSEEQMRQIIYSLRTLSRQLNMHIMLISQRAHNYYGEVDETPEYPYWHQRGDGGACNEVADLSLHLIRPEYYGVYLDEKGHDLRSRIDVHILKNRNGSTGKVSLKFNRYIGRLEDEQTVEYDKLSLKNDSK